MFIFLAILLRLISQGNLDIPVQSCTPILSTMVMTAVHIQTNKIYLTTQGALVGLFYKNHLCVAAQTTSHVNIHPARQSLMDTGPRGLNGKMNMNSVELQDTNSIVKQYEAGLAERQ